MTAVHGKVGVGLLLGFLPWILYWALVGNVDFRFAVCIALAVVIGTQLVSLCRQIRLLHQGFFSGMPVIPSAIIGTDIIAPPGKIITKIVSPTVRFGEL